MRIEDVSNAQVWASTYGAVIARISQDRITSGRGPLEGKDWEYAAEEAAAVADEAVRRWADLPQS